jgi:hypothetical protein
VFGDGKTALRGGFGIVVGRNWTVDHIGALAAGQGPMMAPPNFQAPVILYTNFNALAGAQSSFTPQNVIGGPQDQKVQSTYNWSLGIQRELTRGMVLEVSYVANRTASRIRTGLRRQCGCAANHLDAGHRSSREVPRSDQHRFLLPPTWFGRRSASPASAPFRSGPISAPTAITRSRCS